MGPSVDDPGAQDFVEVTPTIGDPGPTPTVSVLLPVRDGERYLWDSIASILGQSLGAFELLILDDASGDGTGLVLAEFARRDSRLRLFRSPQPLGVGPGLNHLAAQVRGALAARMDADDVAHPDRLRRQWEILQARPEVVLVGTLWEGIDGDGHLVRPRDRWPLWRRWPAPPFPAGSVMFRVAAFRAVEGYRDLPWEDVDLAVRMARRGVIVVVPDALYRYRFHTTSASQRHARPAMVNSLIRMQQSLAGMDRDGSALVLDPRRERRQDASARIRAEYFLEASRVWAGHRPGPDNSGPGRWSPTGLKLRLLRTLGRRGPGALRRLLRTIIRTRDAMAGVFLGRAAVVEWRGQAGWPEAP